MTFLLDFFQYFLSHYSKDVFSSQAKKNDRGELPRRIKWVWSRPSPLSVNTDALHVLVYKFAGGLDSTYHMHVRVQHNSDQKLISLSYSIIDCTEGEMNYGVQRKIA